MAQQGVWNITKKENVKTETCSGNTKAMHEENFLGSWLREDVEAKEEEKNNMNKEAKEEESK